jgi:NTE family protein
MDVHDHTTGKARGEQAAPHGCEVPPTYITPEPNATAQSKETFLPKPKRERHGLALCLSGGGFRSTLFHLGALRRLNELGVLSQVDTFSTVSGGSILSALLAAECKKSWPKRGEVMADWDGRITNPIRCFARQDIRTIPIVKRLLPWNWRRSETQVRALEKRYYKEITQLRLDALPDAPNFMFCSADLSFGVLWVSEKRRIGNYIAGYLEPPPSSWTVARAVAASSCFPPVFDPLRPRLPKEKLKNNITPKPRNYDDLVENIGLTDGGIYDNMGLEAVWKSHETLLVSDGGATFDPEWDRGFKGIFWRLPRYAAVAGKQSSAIRRRWLMSNFILGEIMGTYWGIGSSTDKYVDLPSPPVQGYDATLVDDYVSEVRTDFDAFTTGEIAVLENHGYSMAEAAIRRYAPHLVTQEAALFALPHPDWIDAERVMEALEESHRIKLFGHKEKEPIATS